MDEDPDEMNATAIFSNTTVARRDAASEYLYWLRRYSRHLLPLLCSIGIMGNCMALLLIRTNFWLKKLTSNIYLCALSICGCLFLSTVLVSWADSVYSLPLYNANDVGCKLFTFLAHFCDFICVWMISWISLDRMIVLYRPQGIHRVVNSKTFARNVVIGTIVAAVALYGWFLLFAGLETQAENGAIFCGLKGNSTIFGYTYNARQFYIHLTMVDTIICTIVPSILIVVVNIFSIYRYHQCMKIYATGVLRVRFDRNENSEAHLEETTAKRLLLSQTGASITQATNVSTRSGGVSGGKLRSSDLQLSRSLLVVTSTFVLLNLPNYIFRITDFIFAPSGHVFSFLFYFTFILYYLHHTVLFYMYIFWSPQMKKQLGPTAMRLLECYCFKAVPEFGHRSTSLQAFNR
ncbi:hypothetical protein PENTCL1PPCAC_23922 [Pristionchus entomophagus]|uniref:G-protein coupled receptors family 1 profile domain-containing protein n=1 Tax=Pristionchus entomophagus TaxID=358040 RepID=A0AAV5U5U7_9BILA|nr:hypothetical protein PENTCL1PPCAC_23922 [Pristionchus entomophagus]